MKLRRGHRRFNNTLRTSGTAIFLEGEKLGDLVLASLFVSCIFHHRRVKGGLLADFSTQHKPPPPLFPLVPKYPITPHSSRPLSSAISPSSPPPLLLPRLQRPLRHHPRRARKRNTHKRLRVRGTRLAPAGLVRRRDLLRPHRDVEVVDGPVEQLQRRDRLVEGHLVPALVHPGEGEVAVLARLAVLLAVDHEGDVGRLAELGCLGVLGGERDRLAAEPVADVVGVAVDEGDAHGAAIQDGFEVLYEIGPDEVALFCWGGC